MTRIRIVLLLLAVFTVANAECLQKTDLLKENRLLESEAKVARKSKIYVVFDLGRKEVSIRARGMELTGFPVLDASLWGNPLTGRPLSLAAKGAFIKPGRKRIEPGQEKEQGAQETFEPDTLEVNDMPARYTLYLEGGVTVCVRPAPHGIFLHLINAGHALTRTLARPFYSAWAFFRNKPFTEVDITLNDRDARALYWAMTEGTSCILAPP